MQKPNQIFAHLAPLLSYPDAANLQHLESLLRLLGDHPEHSARVRAFAEFAAGAEMTAIEELFTKTFDLNPACCLEIGWHLFGEDYKRGEFLVNMRQSLHEEHLQESVELPDHLSHCLQLLALLDLEDARAFAKRFLLPALNKILQNLGAENPYNHLLLVLKDVLQEGYGMAGEDVMLSDVHGKSGRQLPVLNSY